jgi:hypothetical protein
MLLMSPILGKKKKRRCLVRENVRAEFISGFKFNNSASPCSAYQSGLAAMKSLLGPDAVLNEAEATMSELAELLEAAEDVSQVLAAGTAAAEEDTDLEQELEQVMHEQEEESALLDQLDKLMVEGGDLEPTIGGSVVPPSPVKNSNEVSPLSSAKQKMEMLPAV